jgi:hypothetical protein
MDCLKSALRQVRLRSRDAFCEANLVQMPRTPEEDERLAGEYLTIGPKPRRLTTLNRWNGTLQKRPHRL